MATQQRTPVMRRVEVLLETEEYAMLEEAARLRGTSVKDIVRETVAEQLVTPLARKRHAAQALIAMDVDIGDWPQIKESLDKDASARYETS
jgi:uncharacterized protein (DUF1778 family)